VILFLGFFCLWGLLELPFVAWCYALGISVFLCFWTAPTANTPRKRWFNTGGRLGGLLVLSAVLVSNHFGNRAIAMALALLGASLIVIAPSFFGDQPDSDAAGSANPN
jgi:hypothetical protein